MLCRCGLLLLLLPVVLPLGVDRGGACRLKPEVKCVHRMMPLTLVKIVYPVQEEPVPVLIFLSGADCPHECYAWLATALAEKGVAVVLASSVADAGFLLSLPYDGKQLESLETYRDPGPAAAGLRSLLDELSTLDFLDLSRLVLGGHSMGGRAALDTIAFGCDFVKFAFAYGTSLVNAGAAHPGDDENFYAKAGTVVPFETSRGPTVPLLLLGGDKDGVQAALSTTKKDATETVKRTFYEATSTATDLVILKDANHMFLAHPAPSPPHRAANLDFRIADDLADHRRAAIVDLLLAAMRQYDVIPTTSQQGRHNTIADCLEDHQDIIAFKDSH